MGYTFGDLLRSENLNCDVIVGSTRIPFVWNKNSKVEQRYQPILDAEFTMLPKGDIAIHSDYSDLVEEFLSNNRSDDIMHRQHHPSTRCYICGKPMAL